MHCNELRLFWDKASPPPILELFMSRTYIEAVGMSLIMFLCGPRFKPITYRGRADALRIEPQPRVFLLCKNAIKFVGKNQGKSVLNFGT